jgi:hypothetical protein
VKHFYGGFWWARRHYFTIFNSQEDKGYVMETPHFTVTKKIPVTGIY